MIASTYSRHIIIACITLFGFAACSKNSTAPDDGPEAKATLTVSGAVNGEKRGTAAVVSSEGGNMYTLDISIHDGVSGPQTFSLSIMMTSYDEPVDLPGTGDYTIGGITGSWDRQGNFMPGEDFWAIYKVINPDDYSIHRNSGRWKREQAEHLPSKNYRAIICRGLLSLLQKNTTSKEPEEGRYPLKVNSLL